MWKAGSIFILIARIFPISSCHSLPKAHIWAAGLLGLPWLKCFAGCWLCWAMDRGTRTWSEVLPCWKAFKFLCTYLYAYFWTTQMMKGPHIGRRTGRAGTAQSGEEKAPGDLINMYKYNVCKYKDTKRTEPGSFQWCPMTGPEAVGTNWNTGGSLWTSRNFLTVSVIEHWHRLPKEVVESPTLEILKKNLDIVLGNCP